MMIWISAGFQAQIVVPFMVRWLRLEMLCKRHLRGIPNDAARSGFVSWIRISVDWFFLGTVVLLLSSQELDVNEQDVSPNS